MNINSNVIATLQSKNGDISTFYGENLITTAGREFYARALEPIRDYSGAVDFYTNPIIELQSGGKGPEITDDFSDITLHITESRHAILPSRNNTDALNTALQPADRPYAITYKVEYAEGDFHTTQSGDIVGGCIYTLNAGDASNTAPTANAPLLAYWHFGVPFSKRDTDSLTIWISHVVGSA